MNTATETLAVCDSPKAIRETIRFISNSLATGSDYEHRAELTEELKKRGWVKAGSGCSSIVLRLGKYAIKVSSDDFNEVRPLRRHPLFKQYAPRVYWVHSSGRAMLCEYVDLFPGDENVTYEEWRADKKRIETEFAVQGLSGYDLHSGNIMRRKDDGRVMVVDYECFYG